MCGIAGVFHFEGQPPDPILLKAMTDVIEHRGPDDEGFYINGPIGLGHRRLSILDLSPAGHQPMKNANGELWIVFNGEIYNYLEIRQELIKLGYEFHTDTDTEVILVAYEHYGTDCLKKFNGMWAFALWDSRQKVLFCSRDRFGIKPFYYYADTKMFIFASEPKALFQNPRVPNMPSEAAIYTFLSTGVSNQGEATFFQKIRQLPPGHFLWVENAEFAPQCFWDLAESSAKEQTVQNPVEKFRSLFEDSIRLRLRSDVPIGTCLSGGLDSSSIVCTAKEIIDKQPTVLYKQETFSSCFDNPIYDERPFIQKVLDKTKARANFLFPSPEQLKQDLNKLVYMQDEPFASLSIFAQWCVMKTVKKSNVKVLLDGQGSDEMLAGYGFDGLFWSELFYTSQFSALMKEIQTQIKKKPAYCPADLEECFFPKGSLGKNKRQITPLYPHPFKNNGKLKCKWRKWKNIPTITI